MKSAKGQGVTTNAEGNFELPVTQEFPLTLVVNYIGYRPLEIDVYDAEEPVIIDLGDNSSLINEVVVVGYGTQRRKELTGSIASVSKEQLGQISTSFDELLGGTVAGLNVTASSGQPGASNNIRIRGGNSITGGNEPLYVIDGVLIYNDNSSTSAGITRSATDFNPLASINPNDIENIEILKDVSATAIYGSRGANGVIIVTTKSGKKGRTDVEYSYSLGISHVTKKLDLLSAKEWGELYLEIASANDIAASGITAEGVATWGNGSDWQDAAFRTALTQTHQVSISGGNDKTRYLISGNYTDQDGIIINTGFKRYNGRLNLEQDLFKGVTVGVNVTASKSEQNGLVDLTKGVTTGGNSNTLEYLLRIPQIVPIYNEDGSYNHNNPFESGDLRKGDITPNPIADLNTTVSQNKNNSLLGNAFLKWNILPELLLKLSASTNIINTTQNYYAPSNTAGGIAEGGYGSVGNNRYDSYQYEATLDWTKSFGKHAFDILGGYSSQVSTSEYAIASAKGFNNETLTYHSLQSGSIDIKPTTGGITSTLHSFLGRVNYTFNHRYNVTATIRADGSSRFAANNRWGYFPSIGASWNVDEESFLKKNKIIDELKVRASIGTVGNQEIADYSALALYSTVPAYFGSTSTVGYQRTNLENPDLKWETTSQYDFGFDLSILKHRLNFVFDVYYKKTSDLLLNVSVEQTTGFSSQLRNIGNVTNKGVEFAVNASIIQSKDLNWNVSANIAHNKNKITNLGSTDYILDSSNSNLIIKTGESLGSFYGWQFDGIVQTGDDLSAVPAPSTKPTVEYGDVKYVDQNGDNVIDQDNDRVVLGSIQPDFTYGFSTTLTYKDWTLFASFQGSQGNDIYNSLRQTLETPSKNYNGSKALLNRWTTDNPSTTIGKAYSLTTYANYLDSRYVEDGSFLKLKNLTLSYILPVRINSAPKTRIKVFASATNLFTITGYKGYDPEIASGIDNGNYPSARTYTFGVNLNF